MGWDRGRYYTRSRKVNGRVVREYVGIGELAVLAAQQDAIIRADREAERALVRAEKAELVALDAPLNELNKLADVVARAALLAAGSGSTSGASGGSDVSDATQSADAIPNGLDEWQKFLDRAQSGDTSTLPSLRKMFKNPALVNDFGGNLAEQAEQSFIKTAAGNDLEFREALTRKLELMRTELVGPNPTPVERLLVERIVACWLQVQDADVRYAQAKNLTKEWGDYFQRRMDRAHKRYLSAIKTLAVVRRLALPVLQVNIAKKQVNVAGPCVTPEDEGDEA